MPALDRRVTLRFTATYFDNFGEVQTATLDRNVWATRMDRAQRDKSEAGGDLVQASRLYRVRYTTDLTNLPTVPAELLLLLPASQRDDAAATLNIVDADEVMNLDNEIEAKRRGERRRFIDLEVIGEVTP